jgi:hypothetical protein
MNEIFSDRESGPPSLISPDQEKSIARVIGLGDAAPGLKIEPRRRGVGQHLAQHERVGKISFKKLLWKYFKLRLFYGMGCS